jgi:RNA polymerase sigma-70 factor, ECF subfamily
LNGERFTPPAYNSRITQVTGVHSPDPSRSPGVGSNDEGILRALREGDEQVFRELVEQWSGIMLRIALAHVATRAVAEEVVQDAWLTVLRSLDRFERRSTFRTWVLGIVVNVSRSRARAERRTIALPTESEGCTVDPASFLPANHARWPRHWAVPPRPWRTPEEDLLAGETRSVILAAIDALPPAHREVLVLRDIEGLSSTEVCNVLELTATNQRVLLHRARARVRQALERYFAATETP